MTIYDLKPKFQNLLRPVVIRLFNAGITANQVTLAAMFLSLLTGFILILFPDPRLFLLLPPVLFIRMALNAIDGMLAREHHQKSRFGAILNELGDVVSDTILYFPFVLLFPGAAIWILLTLFLSVLTEFIGVLAQTIGASRRYDGLPEKVTAPFCSAHWVCGLRFSPHPLTPPCFRCCLRSLPPCCFLPVITVSGVRCRNLRNKAHLKRTDYECIF